MDRFTVAMDLPVLAAMWRAGFRLYVDRLVSGLHEQEVAHEAAEKAQDMAEVGVTMNAWEHRAKWYGEDERTAKARTRGLKRADSGDANGSRS